MASEPKVPPEYLIVPMAGTARLPEAVAKPDPSVLAREQVLREVGLLRELIEARLRGLDELVKGQERDIIELRDKLGEAKQTITRDSAKTAVLESQAETFAKALDERVSAVRESAALALDAAEKTTAIAQSTADKAMARSEAAATKEHLQSQIEGLRESVIAQIVAQKEAITAALTAAKDALSAALASSEKAISKNEEAISYRFAGVERLINEVGAWQRRIELQFGDYVLTRTYQSNLEVRMQWQSRVDEQLTEARSRSGERYAVFAAAIAVLGVLIAVYNLFSKT